MPIRPQSGANIAARPNPVAMGWSARSQQRLHAAENAPGPKRVLADLPQNLYLRQALATYLEVGSLQDEAQGQLWFKVDVYV
ncbi:MAG: hypothetical protein N3A55_09905 [Methylohalobius sp.]|nr:hypothetical protein [Methylohalobius sp.]